MMRADFGHDDVERIRRGERVATRLAVDVRQTGYYARIPAVITNLSITGFHLQSQGKLKLKGRIWVRIGSLAPLMAEVIWNDAGCAGCAFSQPLHPAILDHIVGAAK
jgi:hypothetical protein